MPFILLDPIWPLMLCFDALRAVSKSSQTGIFKNSGTKLFPYVSSPFVIGGGFIANVLITIISLISLSPCLLEYSFVAYDTITWHISVTVALYFLATDLIPLTDMSFKILISLLMSPDGKHPLIAFF
jgi:hypothetical protein